MVLDFGLIQQKDNLQTADYRSAGSHQSENLKIVLLDTQANTWVEIHTVTIGKTFYVSGVVISTNDASTTISKIGVGAAASEVDVFLAVISEALPLLLPMPTPIKFSSGTRIAVRSQSNSKISFTLIGWEE